jgi:hypothetical protein
MEERMSFTAQQSRDVESRLQSQLEASGISPDLISTVMEMVLALLSNCRNKQQLQAGMQSPGRLERALVRQQLRKELADHGQSKSRAELDRLTDAILEAARTAPEEDRDQLVAYTSQYDTF